MPINEGAITLAENKRQTGVRLSSDLLLKFEHLAVDERLSLARLIEKALLEWWDSHSEHAEKYGAIETAEPKKPGPKPKSK
jgi:hypothetical protein